MSRTKLISSILATCLVSSLAATALAEAPRMKMTTDVPPGIATPDKLETRLGTLSLFDGVPDKGEKHSHARSTLMRSLQEIH